MLKEVLVEDVFFVDIFHDIGSDDCVQIGFHEIKNEVDIFIVFGFQNVE